MSTANATATINDRSAWLVGGLGVVCICASLGMIWTTRDVSTMQTAQLEWMRDRIALVERDNTSLRDRIAILEAYESQRRQR